MSSGEQKVLYCTIETGSRQSKFMLTRCDIDERTTYIPQVINHRYIQELSEFSLYADAFCVSARVGL